MNTLPIKLRDYQHAAVNSILKELEVQQFVCVELAPGTGKSLVVAELYSRLESRHIAIIVGNLRLAHQLRNLFSNTKKKC
jgi:superfamily II DNA or RNA helicase